MIKNKSTEKFAKSLLRGIKAAKEHALSDRRSNAAYWNGDDWGSISGAIDASNWVEEQVVNYVVKRVRNFKK
jgi:hypothetical protein